jgi:hypothetical protein
LSLGHPQGISVVPKFDLNSLVGSINQQAVARCGVFYKVHRFGGYWGHGNILIHTQAKLMYAVTTHTPSEMVISRANAEHENMGLRSWKGDHVTQADVDISKNYLAEGELKEFNRLTVILLDIFEDQLDLGKLNTMAEVATLLDNQLRSLSRQVLRGGGSVKTAQARTHALEQYREFNAKRKAVRFAEADAALSALKAQEKLLPKPPRRTRKPS